MKQSYFWATPSGPINLIKADDMPVRLEHPCEAGIPGPGCPICIGYELDLEAAKESSVPIQDQVKFLKAVGLTGDLQPDTIYGPFNLEYRIEEVFSHCTVGEKHYVKVAILLPEKESQEYNIESLRKELSECKQAYNQQLERNAAIAKDLEYWAQRSADLFKELQQLRNQTPSSQQTT